MLNKLRMIPLVIALVAGVFAFPPPAKACHFVFCDSTVGLCPDSGEALLHDPDSRRADVYPDPLPL